MKLNIEENLKKDRLGEKERNEKRVKQSDR